ncbi:MAG: inositol monophosphatase family protein, partial [Alphaproteobacteria bacterium]
YKLALVAAGRFDALISLWGKHEWDLAAGDLLVSEAGGHVTTAEGEALAYNRENSRLPSCVASNGRLHDALMAALEP